MMNPIMKKKLNKFLWVTGALVVAALLTWLWVTQGSAMRAQASFESWAGELGIQYTSATANFDKERDGATTVTYVDSDGVEKMATCTCDVGSYFMWWQRSCTKFDAIRMNGSVSQPPPKVK